MYFFIKWNINTFIFQLESLVESNVTTPVQKAIKSAISTAKSNSEWASQRKSQINDYFESITTVSVIPPTTLCSTSPVTEEVPTPEDENSAKIMKSSTIVSISLLVLTIFTYSFL